MPDAAAAWRSHDYCPACGGGRTEGREHRCLVPLSEAQLQALVSPDAEIDADIDVQFDSIQCLVAILRRQRGLLLCRDGEIAALKEEVKTLTKACGFREGA